jgi:hypothetical protein
VIFAVFWNLMAGGAGFITWRQGVLTEKPPLGVILALFNIVGLGLIAVAVYYIMAAKKFAATTFQMERMPGVLGGTLSGLLLVPPRVPDGLETTVALECTRYSRVGRSSSSSCIWKDELRGQASGGCLRVAFTVPFDVPPTDPVETAELSTIHWYLSARGQMPGVDYAATLEVPVFATPASDRTIVAGAVREPTATAAAANEGPPPNAKATIEDRGDGTAVVTFPKASGLGCAVVSVLLLPAVAAAITVGMGGDPLVVLGWVATAFVAGAGLAALAVLGVLITVVRLEIGGGSMTISYGQAPLARARTIALADISEVKYATSGQTPTPRVDVRTVDGKLHQVAGGLSGVEEAKWLATQLWRLVERARARS